MTNEEVSKQRGLEGSVQVGGIFAIITSFIELVRYFAPDLPWAQIMPFIGAIVAYFVGGEVSKAVHKLRVGRV